MSRSAPARRVFLRFESEEETREYPMPMGSALLLAAHLVRAAFCALIGLHDAGRTVEASA